MLLIFENDLKLQRIGKKHLNQDSSTIPTFLLANIIRKEREWYILPQSTHWVEVCLFSSEFFSDAQFKESFRMSRTSFYTLHELLRPFIEKKSTQFREPVPSDRRLAIFSVGTATKGIIVDCSIFGSQFIIVESLFPIKRLFQSHLHTDATKKKITLRWQFGHRP